MSSSCAFRSHDPYISLGRKEWDGLSLHTGYFFRAGGREIELDASVTAADIPVITGVVEDEIEPDDTAGSLSPLKRTLPSELRSTNFKKENETLTTVSAERPRGSIPPALFYASSKKVKHAGPRYVIVV